jgi:hypothetical protein
MQPPGKTVQEKAPDCLDSSKKTDLPCPIEIGAKYQSGGRSFLKEGDRGHFGIVLTDYYGTSLRIVSEKVQSQNF